MRLTFCCTCCALLCCTPQVLMPAALLSIPKVSLAEALSLVGGSSDAPAPAPASED
jgi:hypothetical protein